MYWKVAPVQGHFYVICTRLWDGRGAGVFAGVSDGWGPPIASEYKAQKVHFGREYKLRMTEDEGFIKCYLDGELALKLKMDKRFTAGVVGLFIINAKVYFDDFVVTSDNIPDGGPGLGKAVGPKSKLAITWGKIKWALE
ncbi:MAG: hypothetical protein ACE5NM_13755 [Sedimentisphaerales bacterium]